MKLFRKKRQNDAGERNRIPLTIMKSVNSIYAKLQERWVKALERSTKGFTRRTWIIILILYSIAGLATTAYLLISAIKQ